ncbi:MAG: hypothetical protein KAT09_02260, partial [Candidatus Aegiribacteria sp.]|nr:hypothetical protein [Candidatus Aegiribacteria sp.]
MNEHPISTDGYKADYPSGSDLKKLISQGEYLKAFELGDEYLRNTEKPDPEIVKQHSLCMSKLGMIEEAIEMLKSLKKISEAPDPELLALLGSFYKRKWLELINSDPANAESALDSSFINYMDGRESGGDFWCTVNASSLALILGRRELSVELADEVIAECWDIYNKHGTTSEFWVPASMGEAYLIKGDFDSATRWYKGARSHVGSSIGQIKTTRTNAKVLLNLLEADDISADEILGCIRKPRIAIFAGHRIDRPGRISPRFPEHISSRIKTLLKKKLIEMKLDIGIASAADGADILFHECLQETGKRTHIILPSPIEHFRTKIFESENENWCERFDRIVQQADRVEISSTSEFISDAVGMYHLSADYMLEYSLDITEAFDGELIPVVIWDQHPAKQPGGTGYIVSRLKKLGYDPVRIPITDLGRTRADRHSGSSPVNEYPYSKLGIYEPVVRPIVVICTGGAGSIEEERASIMNRFLEKVSSICKEESLRMLSAGSITESIYLIMDSVNDARNLIRSIHNCNPPLPEHSLVLHAGLVTMLNSSLSGRRDYYCREI